MYAEKCLFCLDGEREERKMAGKYFYNTKTHRLHIYGNCRESKMLPYNVKFFETENEALAFDGRAVGLCQICQKKRDQKENNK